MSRHELDSLNPVHEVAVGWDPPMRTYFAQVLDTAGNEEDGTYEVLWIGTRFQEVLNPASVVAAVAPFATVPADLLGQLARDRLADE